MIIDTADLDPPRRATKLLIGQRACSCYRLGRNQLCLRSRQYAPVSFVNRPVGRFPPVSVDTMQPRSDGVDAQGHFSVNILDKQENSS